MASEQIKELLAAAQDPQLVDPEDVISELSVHETEPPAQPESKEQSAAEILSAPPPDNQDAPSGTSSVLKTRKQLIQKIKEVCEHRGVDIKNLNLARRRKASLKDILQVQFAEAAETQVEHKVHEKLNGILPEGMEARQKFAVDMMYRLDLTLCRVLEQGVSVTDTWHGLSAEGFAQSIEGNETLSQEIRDCWLEIVQEPENEWVLDYVGAGTRLLLCHMYGLLNVVRQKRKGVPKHEPQKHQPRPAPNVPRFVPRQALPPLAPRRSTGKLRNLALLRQESGKDDSRKNSVSPRAGGMVIKV